VDGIDMQTRDLRIESIRPLVPPAILLEEHPLSEVASVVVTRARDEIVQILNGKDDRLLVVVGPCSIHDPAAGMEYGRRLKAIGEELSDDLCIVMRVYFEKPRTTLGWKGLINDPHLDGSCRSNEGLRLARRLLLDLLDIGMPAGCEFLDPISPQFISDVVVWGAIGARTVESQVHRQLASGLSVPVGFKNGTDGRAQPAIDAIRASNHPHSFFGVTEKGLAAIVTTTGNPNCHVILRGGETGTNYDRESVQDTLAALEKVGLPRRLMIDTSHGNSGKDHRRQPVAAHEIAQQIADGEHGIQSILLESFLVDGRQDLVSRETLVYGQSITDACMGWEMTVPVLHDLASAVRTRRGALVGV
jgi:3-deoxy-7-phosphoheptulonate synthase